MSENGTFFRSRWVDAPAAITELEPGVLPRGFRASGLACGIKPSRRLDIGVVACDGDATSAAMFTRNALVAAAVEVSREQRQRQRRHEGAGPGGCRGDGR